MNGLRFAWDEAKAAENLRKHGVSFEEGASVFADENARLPPQYQYLLETHRNLVQGMLWDDKSIF